MALAGVTAALVSHLRDRAMLEIRNELSILSLVLADQADRAFEAVDLLQATIIERLIHAGVQTPEAFRQAMTGRAMHEDLRSRSDALPQLDAVTAIDADGRLLNFSRYWPIPQVSVADRDYFRALTADPGLRSFIGGPVPNRGTGTWTIYVARKVSGPGGEFLGLILGAVELSYFERLYASVVRHAGGSVVLFRQDGTMLARHPHVEARIGQSYAAAPMVRRLQDPAVRSAVLQQFGAADGRERVVAGHRLARFPLIVTAGVTLDDALADWRQQAGYMIGIAALLELALAGAMLLLARQWTAAQHLARAQAARTEAEAALALARAEERAEREQQLQELRFGAALANMSQALCMFDAEGRLVVANARLTAMFGLPPAATRPGIGFDAMMAHAATGTDLDKAEVEAFRRSMRRLIHRGVPAESLHELADGRALTLVFQPTGEQGWLATIEDTTERRRAEARIAHMAHHDALTGLPNRVLFHKRLGQAIARGRRGERSALLCLDLDLFKQVNDTLGHPVGDALLRAVTHRLQQHVREGDTIARLGGDEFAIVQCGIQHAGDAAALAARLIEAVGAPYEIESHSVTIGTSIGIAMMPADGEDADQLLKHADLALYRAKADGRGRHRRFAPKMDAEMQGRRRLEISLRQALLAEQFEVFYQPLVHLQSRCITGFEALLRWRDPERGLVPPAEFIPVAEEIGLIVPLGQWVLRRACADAVGWPGGLRVAVNLSAVQFASRTLVQDVAAALAASGLTPQRLELEITETVMIEDTEATLDILHRLRALGVGIAMDDFGTGYSSLSYLRRFPFDKVKIDRSFIEEIGQGGDSDIIIEAVTDLCHRLGIATTAEGVETEDQYRLLLGGQCSEVQGFLFSRPCPASEVLQLCAALGPQGLMAQAAAPG